MLGNRENLSRVRNRLSHSVAEECRLLLSHYVVWLVFSRAVVLITLGITSFILPFVGNGGLPVLPCCRGTLRVFITHAIGVVVAVSGRAAFLLKLSMASLERDLSVEQCFLNEPVVQKAA